MTETEEYFPRGGKKPSVVFKQSANFLGTSEKTEKKKRKPKKKPEGDDGYLSDEETREIDQSSKNCAVGLSFQTIKQGVSVLGRVRHIHETRMTVMLPSRIIGNVMACHISEPYNKMLEAYVNDQTEKVSELSKMFRPGQYIAVKVLEVKERNLMLSTMPQHLNSGKTHADIVKGALFQAAVSSVEDHGYVMDLGVPNTRAFLAKKDANDDIELMEGMVTWCAIKSASVSSDSCIVSVTNSPAAIQDSFLKRAPSGGVLLPGTAVRFTVSTPLENGIEGSIFGDTTCYIQRQHVDKVKGKRPALGQKIMARVLYVMPTRNTPFLTMKNIFDTTFPNLEEEQKLKEGDIVDDAQVIRITGRSIHFRLGSECFGTMSLKQLQVDEDLTDEQIVAKSYPIGSTHKVRVLCYYLSDYVYSVSDAPSVVTERYFSMSQLRPGELVTATVAAINEGRIQLQVGRVTGFVPMAHVTETGIFVDPKKGRTTNLTQKKYKVGQTVTARVLVLDLPRQTLLLTLKPSLLDAGIDVLCRYEDAIVGRAYTGVIRVIRDYLLVTFFDNVTAFVPRALVSKDREQNIADAFHVGQIVTCTIINVDPESKKMSGSLTTEPFSPEQHRPRTKKKLDAEEVSQNKSADSEPEEDSKRKRKRKDSETSDSSKKRRKDTESSDLSKKKRNDSESSDCGKKKRKDSDTSETSKKKKTEKVKIREITETENAEQKVSEESDAIETDFNESEDILTPQEQGLLDMSDCTTIKDYKKRIVAITKSIAARKKRFDVVDEKITNIEEKGLTAKNKKYHTAMHTEKLMLQQRINMLLDGVNDAEEKLKELGYVRNENYKEEQKKRKKEKAQANKQPKLTKRQESLAKKKAEGATEDSDIETEQIPTKDKNKPPKDIDRNVSAEEVSVKENKDTKAKKSKLKKKDNLVTESNEDEDVFNIISAPKALENLTPALEVPSVKNFWSENTETVSNTVQEDESSSSDEEEKDQPKKKRKKLSVAEKLAKAREADERVRRLEAEALTAESQPRSVDHFERSLLAQPGNSQMWIAYMAFHLQSTELDKARAVARKALNAIPFREEDEKLNVWLALLNLEHRFGTKESQQKVLEDALQTNDRYKIHTGLLDILVETGKQSELCAIVDLMLRKYKRKPDCYVAAGRACFQLGLVEKARQVMQKAVSLLEKKEHVGILVQFALLERGHGSRERGEALFEQVLAVYPQRVDVACVYTDTLLKAADVEHVRQVMERLTSLKLPARKMKVLYKKWIEVEEKIGDEAHVANIKQRAVEFIEQAKF